MTQTDIDKLLAGRKLIDDLNNTFPPGSEGDDHTTAVEQFEQAMHDMGFTTVGDFYVFNMQMCQAAFYESCRISGTCDGCEGVEGGRVCVNRYGEKACFYHSPTPTSESVLRMSWIKYQRFGNVLHAENDDLGCPVGHGFHDLQKESRVLPFDVLWGIKK